MFNFFMVNKITEPGEKVKSQEGKEGILILYVYGATTESCPYEVLVLTLPVPSFFLFFSEKMEVKEKKEKISGKSET